MTPWIANLWSWVVRKLQVHSIKPHDITKSWVDRLGVNLVVDVGANEGQFAYRMRQMGYRGEIVSFEPLREAFEKLKVRNMSSKNWRGLQMALGERDDERTMEVAGNDMMSSSLLPMLPNHVEVLPTSAIFKTEKVKVRRLDETLKPLLNCHERIFLKVDTQGFEDRVLKGATGILANVVLIELELSLVQLYRGQALLPEIVNLVAKLGYVPIDLARGFEDGVRGKLLQVDGLFVRKDLLGTEPLRRSSF